MPFCSYILQGAPLYQLPKKGIRRSLMYLLEIFIQHSFLKTTFYEANQVLKNEAGASCI